MNHTPAGLGFAMASWFGPVGSWVLFWEWHMGFRAILLLHLQEDIIGSSRRFLLLQTLPAPPYPPHRSRFAYCFVSHAMAISSP